MAKYLSGLACLFGQHPQILTVKAQSMGHSFEHVPGCGIHLTTRQVFHMDAWIDALVISDALTK